MCTCVGGVKGEGVGGLLVGVCIENAKLFPRKYKFKETHRQVSGVCARG